uniref:Uncharacterized protein n=1 Tax=viral metagenome TaxID=1070528 RepID=A0A6C0DMC8_9ZZZZ
MNNIEDNTKMLLQSSTNQNTVTSVPAITYLFVGLTSFVLAYFTAMDKGEDSESLPKDESVTSMLPGLGTAMTESENGEEKPSDEESTMEPESEPEPSESETNPPAQAPLAGGKKRKNSIKKQIKKIKSKRSTKSRST